jgi:hypothetical protein
MTSESTDGSMRKFAHPFLQACGMFLGEMLCMLVFVAIRYRRRKKREMVSCQKFYSRPFFLLALGRIYIQQVDGHYSIGTWRTSPVR